MAEDKTDMLASGELIKERLKTEVPEFTMVEIKDSLQDVIDSKFYSPCAFIVYGGYELERPNSEATPKIKINVIWDIILCLHGQQWVDGGVGTTYTKVFEALVGWKPSNKLGYVVIRDPRLGAELQNGVAFAPLSISVATYATGKGD